MASSTTVKMPVSNPMDYIAIQNTIAKYCIALDIKDFELLKEVFADDTEAFYPLRKDGYSGLGKITEAIEKRLRPVSSQHGTTTQHIEINADGKSATATTYFTGIHFGKGKWEGKDVTAWGKYIDTLRLFPGQKSLPGASGQWLITRRECIWAGRRGEEGVMEGE